jgi:hypothetical protein
MRFRRSAVPDQITGGVFAVYGAHAGVVGNHGPVTTYGVSDMVIDRSSRECPLGVIHDRPEPQADSAMSVVPSKGGSKVGAIWLRDGEFASELSSERSHGDQKEKLLQHFCICRIFGRKTGFHP